MSGARRVALATALLLALVTTVLVTRPAAADDTEPSVIVVIDDLTPLIASPDSTLRIRGRVISTSRETLTDISVQLRQSAAPLEVRKDIADVAKAGLSPDSGDPDGISLAATRTEIADTLPPGERARFDIAIPFADLSLTQPGTYVLGVEALGVAEGIDTTPVRKGVLRTFLPWFPDEESVRPIDLVWLWPLADWPARDASGVLLDNRTPEEISPEGRLARLLALGSRFAGTVSWVADPALLQTVSAMTGGYTVLVDGVPTVGDRETEAQRWLASLAAVTQASGLRTMPYADIDASAVVRAGMTNDVVRAVTFGPGVAAAALGSVAPGGLYWAPFGRIDRGAAGVLASAGVTAIVLSADAMPTTDPDDPQDGQATTALPTSSGAIRAVLTDPGLTELVSLPERSASDAVLARQRFLAETAMIATSLPVEQPFRSVVVAPDTVRWDPASDLVAPLLRATRTAPWLGSSTLEDLLSGPVSSTSRQRGGYGDRARDAELSSAYMASVARAQADLTSFTSIIDDPLGISEPFSAALLRAQSAAWRTDAPQGRDLVQSIDAELAAETGRVRVLSEGTITFSGDTGRVPVTITNDLDRSVTVGLTLIGRPPLRLEAEPLPGIRIEAGRMASVDIDARVVGGEPLAVEVQLLDGEMQPYGDPAVIRVNSTAYARAAAWVVAAAFLAIIVFVVFGVTRRIRQASRTKPDLGP